MLPGLLSFAFVGGLDWRAPPECAGETDMRAQVELVAGSAVAWSELEVVGQIAPEDGGFVLQLEVRTAAGATVKTLRDPDCAVLGSAAAVVIAVAAQPQFAMRDETPTPTVVPEAAAVAPFPEPPASEPAVPRPELAEPREAAAPELGAIHGAVGAFAGAGAGVLPTVDLSGGVVAAVWGRRWRTELRAAGSMPRTVTYEDTAVGARMARITLRLHAGPRWVVRRFEFWVLGGAALSPVFSRGVGVPRKERPTDLWIAVGVAPAVGLRLTTAWMLTLGVESDLALRRPAVRIDGAPELYRTRRVAAAGVLGVQWRFTREKNRSHAHQSRAIRRL